MSRALAALIEVLSPVPIEPDCYRGLGSSGDGVPATYGGHFLGQATAAALASVDDDRALHSVHAYFLRSGRPGEPIDYRVERVRDGRTFCTRRVVASQGESERIFELLASFSRPEDGRDIAAQPPDDFADLPEPGDLPAYRALMGAHDPPPFPAEWSLREHGVDVRVVNAPWSPNGPSAKGGIRMWIRADGPMPDNPKLHAAMLAYQSDESVSDNVAVPFGVTWGTPGIVMVSLDHAMWYHRPFRMDEWLFVDQWPVSVAQARGLSTAQVWDRSARLVASFTQEALLRVPEAAD